MAEDTKSLISDFVDALRAREWSRLRRSLLLALPPFAVLILQTQSVFGPFRWYALICICFLFLLLFIGEILSRRRTGQISGGLGYNRAIRALMPFREGDAEVFAKLRRASDISRIASALQDTEFRFGVLFSESGAGKTSLLCAGLQPELKKLGYEFHVAEISNREEPLHLVTRLLAATAPAAAPGTADIGGAGDYLWLTRYDSAPREVFLILDQFEQFFLHYKRQEDKEPFLSFLKKWWIGHPFSQLRIWVSIREEYVGKLSVIQEQLQYVLTAANNVELRRFRPEEAVEILRSMAAESGLVFHESAVRQTCEKELASREGTVSPVDLQILATGVLDMPGSIGFTAETLQSLGGLEGALERHLLAQIASAQGKDKIALAILRLLSEFTQGVLSGWRSATELAQELSTEYASEPVHETLRWLASPRVRLTVEDDSSDEKRYRLVHDLLVPAVYKVSGQVLEAAERASLLLDRRTTEYLSNHRHSEFLLSWKEWRFISRHGRLLKWEGREREKRELLLRSERRLKAWGASLIVFIAALCLGWWVWNYQSSLLLWRTRQDLTSAVSQMSDGQVTVQLAKTLFVGGLKQKDPTLTNEAWALLKHAASFFRIMALVDFAVDLANVGQNKRASDVFEQASAIVEQTAPPLRTSLFGSFTTALYNAHDMTVFDQTVAAAKKLIPREERDFPFSQIVLSLLISAETENSPSFIDRALALRELMNGRSAKDQASSQIAATLARLGAKKKENNLINRAFLLGEQISDPSLRAHVLGSVATALSANGETEKPRDLISQAVALTKQIRDPSAASRCLMDIASAEAAIGVNTKDAMTVRQALQLGEQVKATANTQMAIAQALATAGQNRNDPRLIGQALEQAFEISDVRFKTSSLVSIAPALATADKQDNRLRLLDQALAAVKQIGDQYSRASALEGIAEAMVTLGQQKRDVNLIERGLAAADGIEDSSQKNRVLGWGVKALARVGEEQKDASLIHRALAVSRRIQARDELFIPVWLGQVPRALASTEDLREARLAVKDLPVNERAISLAYILIGWDEGRAGIKTIDDN